MKEITLTKNEIDEAIKDKKYPEDFKMTIKFRKSKREEIQGKDKVIRRHRLDWLEWAIKVMTEN